MQSADSHNAVPDMQADILALSAKLKAEMDMDYVYLRCAELLYEKAGLEIHLEDYQAAYAKLQKNHAELQTGFATSMNGLREAHDRHLLECIAENKALIKETSDEYAREFNEQRIYELVAKAAPPFIKDAVIEAHIQGQSDAGKARAKVAAAKRHESSNKARVFVKNEWDKHKTSYNNNKSAFARSYVALIANQFKDAKGDPLKITEDTIKEIWLKDPPVC
jgi:hypothetical protein